ncbi:uncharacterized protein LOC101860565 [Aplysia californica]|uniref:Uncharacterized protein LOC101860565 n=1 Tax=Aplysia californica TaxID=6500 RepID=A0ABM0JMB4_APLCA|nr:uncharacterized protein LOC101860565 [Aplysia californica]
MAVMFLATSDFMLCLATLVYALCTVIKADPFYIPDFSDLYAYLLHVSNWTRAMFVDTSLFLTVFVSLERCPCVTWPLKFKTLFTTKSSAVICSSILCCTIVSYIPVQISHGVSEQYDVSINRTRLIMWYSEDREDLIKFSNSFHRLFLHNVSPASITLSAVFMAVCLRASAVFGQKATSAEPGDNKNNSGAMSKKDSRVVTMVFLVAVVCILLLLPSMLFVSARRALPDLGHRPGYQNLIYTFVGITYMSTIINANVNIFIYYNFNSRYRQFLQKYMTHCANSVA